jgi:hypothetical protein
MKNCLILTFSLIFIGCSTDCGDKPLKRAYIFNDGGYGNMYHVALYSATGGSSFNPHNLKTECLDYEYVPNHIYFDFFGKESVDNVIWKNYLNEEYPFLENGEDKSNIMLDISIESVIVRGFKEKNMNGTYKVVKSSPDSWEVPILNR